MGGLLVPSVSHAAGYDTPILYSARHMGMGGTAIAGVRDGSAPFHNPAGLGHIGAGNLILNVSMLTGHIVSSPGLPARSDHAVGAKSETTVAPFFLLGGGVRATDWLTIGAALYPVASAGAVYDYSTVSPKPPTSAGSGAPSFNTVSPVYDMTRLVFFEFAPTVSLNLPGNLRLGASYRLSMSQFERKQGTPDNNGQVLDLELMGFNFAGFKVGVQWQPIPELEIGAVYRSKTETKLEGDFARYLAVMEFEEASTTFILPDKLGLGVKGNLEPVSFAADFEYTFNSRVQTQIYDLTGGPFPEQQIVNIARWSDGMTLRLGLEYCLSLESQGLDHRIKPRLGYVLDTQVGNKAYPSAFGTPPTDTQTATVGLGYDGGPWEINVAYAYRHGVVQIESDELAAADPEAEQCLPCSREGHYEIALHGAYVDFSYDF